jgi:hypothetical protein
MSITRRDGTITLDWGRWVLWPDVLIDARGGAGVLIPNGVPGVYEVRHAAAESDERLHIGKASDLRMRIRQGLVKGKVLHSAGKRIRAEEDVSQLVIRWAVTDRPGAAEEELHRLYRVAYGGLPRYTLRT